MNLPRRLDITQKQLDAILARAKRLLPQEDYEIIKGMADTIIFLSSTVDKKMPRYRSYLQCYLVQLLKKQKRY